MLSANGDPKLVMKGITHGACDYLLKPVRLEELKIVWQHVIRKKKPDQRDYNKCGLERNSSEGNGTGGANSDQDAKLSRKRKDQNMDDDEDQDENEHENDDPSAQKKPRVVWSVELHRKFVAAVNQLGLESMFSPILIFFCRIFFDDFAVVFDVNCVRLIYILTLFGLHKLFFRVESLALIQSIVDDCKESTL